MGSSGGAEGAREAGGAEPERRAVRWVARRAAMRAASAARAFLSFPGMETVKRHLPRGSLGCLQSEEAQGPQGREICPAQKEGAPAFCSNDCRALPEAKLGEGVAGDTHAVQG